mmetsp:Transcript_39717/g.104898  ORF Transcript_39717/g.104898 Transcript_39717/m.104898 type:complete len:452 (+) Transcript_39717:430-1785(+)
MATSSEVERPTILYSSLMQGTNSLMCTPALLAPGPVSAPTRQAPGSGPEGTAPVARKAPRSFRMTRACSSTISQVYSSMYDCSSCIDVIGRLEFGSLDALKQKNVCSQNALKACATSERSTGAALTAAARTATRPASRATADDMCMRDGKCASCSTVRSGVVCSGPAVVDLASRRMNFTPSAARPSSDADAKSPRPCNLIAKRCARFGGDGQPSVNCTHRSVVELRMTPEPLASCVHGSTLVSPVASLRMADTNHSQQQQQRSRLPASMAVTGARSRSTMRSACAAPSPSCFRRVSFTRSSAIISSIRSSDGSASTTFAGLICSVLPPWMVMLSRPLTGSQPITRPRWPLSSGLLCNPARRTAVPSANGATAPAGAASAGAAFDDPSADAFAAGTSDTGADEATGTGAGAAVAGTVGPAAGCSFGICRKATRPLKKVLKKKYEPNTAAAMP